MANPTSRHSRARRDKRRANWKGVIPHLIKCPDCGELKMPHRACGSCGMYDGRNILEVVEKE
ncbi:MAG: 50S ribosomal protein L32 [Magnetococcales bacterium]|uniref:Large ribosomal subunit protein bL32 n=1 Tax=Candidatus Magnetobacterium casense TaxID=1455061 RepID=A0ABS6S3B1_9BACT|nr:50S ribosomal protein L32 [Candidatus Magnetobacterium casensis]MBF0336494.1 50S ribosomal protein L32 [Nitrospirota bacterium]MBF0607221.1 50S ribosomal protein L32 [Nitrospirota bacterium]MBV6342864.1 50S ribosomal protein L32 [Candidatus Magnetobacterium casensis]